MPRRFAIDQSLYPDTSTERAFLAAHMVELVEVTLADLARFAAAVKGADGLVLGAGKLTPEHLDAATSLQVIGRPGVGLDNIDLVDAVSRGIGVINCPDYCTEEVATHALALILQAVRRLPESDAVARRSWNDWSQIGVVRPLNAATVGIVGAGRSGALLAALIHPMVARVVYVDPAVNELAGAERLSHVDELIAVSDVISLHVPATESTLEMMDTQRLAAMKPGTVLVNVSRGALIDQEALVDALFAGRIRAGLDVLRTEPPPTDERLLTAPNVALIPHSAWYSERSESQVRTDVLDAMLDYLAGTRPTTAVVAADARICSTHANDVAPSPVPRTSTATSALRN